MRFTREARDPIPTGPIANKAVVCISTYSMVAYTGKRTYMAEEAMKYIESQEWGLVLLDGRRRNLFTLRLFYSYGCRI